MANLRNSLSTKTKTKISPQLIKKMELFSLSYQRIQDLYSLPGSSFLSSSYEPTGSLDTFLLDQINNLFVSEKEKGILIKMVELLDHHGLFSNWKHTSNFLQTHYKISPRKTYYLLALFQELEPEGVGATSIKNFLEIQIKKHELTDHIFQNNILNVLSYEQDIIKNNISAVAKKTNLSTEEVNLCLLFIKNNINHTLPRQQFVQNARTVTPSAQISIENNSFNVELLENYSMIEDSELYNLLKERTQTLQRILGVFFQKQRANAYQQTGLLKPVTQKQIAEITQLHVSTISRLVNSKYILLENRLFLLRSLFQRKVSNSNYSSVFIKNFIKLHSSKTDLEISSELKTLGILISRRTVNYYRNKFF